MVEHLIPMEETVIKITAFSIKESLFLEYEIIQFMERQQIPHNYFKYAAAVYLDEKYLNFILLMFRDNIKKTPQSNYAYEVREG